METLHLKARLAMELPAINAAIRRNIDDLPAPVHPVALHVFTAGGKRLRPFLTILSARIFDCRRPELHDLAACMEMLHAATLLHDDVLDNALQRRGKAAAHTVFDVVPTILAGDALLAHANARVASFGVPALAQCFAEATSRTAAGEIMEIAAMRDVRTSQDDYAEIIRGKTAWLIRASCEMGAIFAQADPASREAIADFGENLGMAFQMVDDALDFAPEEITGKPTAGDAREGKLTPPLRLYRLGLSENERLAFDAAFTCGLLTEQDSKDIAALIRSAGHDRQTREEAEAYLAKARACLERLPDRPERTLMAQMTDYVRDRDK